MSQGTASMRRWFRWSLRTMFVLVALAAVAMWFYQQVPRVPVHGDLAWSDVRAVCKVANAFAETKDEPVLSIEVIRPDEVEVTTGEVRGPLSGGGHILTLKKSKGKWTVQEVAMWIS